MSQACFAELQADLWPQPPLPFLRKYIENMQVENVYKYIVQYKRF